MRLQSLLAFLSSFLLVVVTQFDVFAQKTPNDSLLFGAEIFIEPSQSKQEIEGLFKLLHDKKLSLTRIRITESYLLNKQGDYDFSQFDHAFKAADKYQIKIYANLFPAVNPDEIGGLKFPESKENLEKIETYIEKTVNHFKGYKSLYGWVPINEPGSGRLPKNTFADEKYKAWRLQQNPFNATFANERFLLEYNNWYLRFLVENILKWDKSHLIHVNNHALFQLAGEYDFPAWRPYLNSLGGSAHASWHFAYFNSATYVTALSANSEMLRSGAGHLPWLMTELQGGGNIYSGAQPLTPTANEISQWLWTVVSTGGKGALFWSLNSRKYGIEAGEWAMTDLNNQPTMRLNALSRIAETVAANEELLRNAKVEESGINILYTRESLWAEKKFKSGGDDVFAARKAGFVMKSALGFFQALSNLGIQTNLKEIREFDFDEDNYTGKTIILSNQLIIPTSLYDKLINFVEKGGCIMVEGMTANFNEEEGFIQGRTFPFSKLLGGTITDFEVIGQKFEINRNEKKLPSHYIIGKIKPSTGQPIAHFKNEVVGISNNFGKGKTYWFPTLIGLHAFTNNDYGKLAQLLSDLKLSSKSTSFKTGQPLVYIKTLASGNQRITTVINKNKIRKAIEFNQSIKNPKVIYKDKTGKFVGPKLLIDPEETMVFKWIQE